MFKNEPSCLARQNKNFQSETQGKRQRFIQEIKQKEQMCFIAKAQAYRIVHMGSSHEKRHTYNR